MSLHAESLDLLTRWSAPDAEQDALRTSYVEHLVARADGLRRDCYPGHLTAGALVLADDRSRVLLTLHRGAGRWFHLGGHVEEYDATLAGAALRESREESGLTGLVVEAEPLHLSRHRVDFCDPRGVVDHLDVRFLAHAEPGAVPLVSAESLDVRWWPVDALPTADEDIAAMVRLALAR